MSGSWFSENLLVNTTSRKHPKTSLRLSDSVLLGAGNGLLVNSHWRPTEPDVDNLHSLGLQCLGSFLAE